MLTFRLSAVALRALPRGLVAGILATAAAPTLVTAAKGGTDLRLAVVAAAVLAGASAAFMVDEPAGAVAAAAPLARRATRASRLVALGGLIALAAVAIVLVGVAHDPHALDEARSRSAEFASSAGLAAAVAAVAFRHGADGASAAGALCGPLSMFVASALSYRAPWLPSIGMPSDAGRWCEVAVGAWLVAIFASRDPYRR